MKRNQLMNTPSGFTKYSIRLAVFAGFLAIATVLLHRWEWVNFQIAVPGLALATVAGSLAALLGVFGLFSAMRKHQSALPALIGAMLGFVIATPTLFSLLTGAGLPPIHDITTDLEQPPDFQAVVAKRSATDNALNRLSPENLAELQLAGYPDLKPLKLNYPQKIVYAQTLQLVESRSWEVVSASAEAGIIEATVTTPIMAFKDDIVIRLQSSGTMTQVDMRSVSRVGISDLGMNAKRIQLFLADLKHQLESKKP